LSALADNLPKLTSGTLSPADAARALAFVVHFVGDMHQPLHGEDNGDRGGNDVTIKTDGSGVRASILHSLWDGPLVEAALGTDLDVATALVSGDDSAPPPQWTAAEDSVSGVIQVSDTWVEDAHLLAQPAYSLLGVAVAAGPTQGVQVTSNYVSSESQVVRGQIDRAAVRLAAALNAALTWSPPPVQ
jgi:hypothetical protein